MTARIEPTEADAAAQGGLSRRDFLASAALLAVQYEGRAQRCERAEEHRRSDERPAGGTAAPGPRGHLGIGPGIVLRRFVGVLEVHGGQILL